MALVKRNHNPFAKQEDFLYMLIDVTTVEGTAVIALGTMRRIQLLGRLKQAEGKKVIAPPVEGRGFSKLDRLPLQYLYWNTVKTTPPEDYALLVKNCLEVINQMTPNDEHIPSLEYLVEQLDKGEGNPVDGTNVEAKEKAIVRPKGTSVTGIIWTICDEVLTELFKGEVPADNEGWKPLRAEAAKRCDAEGFHTGTFGVQYGKWKASKLVVAPA
jgi:hypothetical protein